jgi:hypothetical protein
MPTIECLNVKYRVCGLDTKGGFQFRFDDLSKKPPFSDLGARRQLLAKINEIPGVRFDESKMTKWSSTTLAKLATPEAVEKLKAAMTWLIEAIKAECEKGASEM